MSIHSSAMVSPEAEIGDDAWIGPPPTLRKFYKFLARESKRGICIRPSRNGKNA
jgi:hypothetical protein